MTLYQENEAREPLSIVDFKILGDKLIVNFDHQWMHFMDVEDLLLTEDELSMKNRSLTKFALLNQNDEFIVRGIDVFTIADTGVLLITKES
jgi:hypothetical protein